MSVAATNSLLIALDIIAGAILVAHAFVAIAHMSRRTRHCIRGAFIVVAVGAVGMVLSPLMDVEWRRYAHVAVVAAWALLVMVDQRKHLKQPGSD